MSETIQASAGPIVSIPVRTATATYEVHIGQGLLAETGSRLAELIGGSDVASRTRIFLVTSPVIDRLWGDSLRGGFASAGFPRPMTLTVPAGEEQKRLATVEVLCEQMARNGANRDSILVAFGGGVLGDLTGFLAAIYMRGIRFVQVPTTLLAQVDSSVGGKTGANLEAGKNLIGAFHQPLAVYADLDTLSTLPPAELRAGLQESVKAGIIRDPGLFDFMEAESRAILAADPEALGRVVADSVRMKAEVVGIDEFENGLRMVLNLGHTLGHAIEAATGYHQLLHGEAIAWGMLAATRIGAARGTVTAGEAERIRRVVRLYGPLKGFAAEAQTLVDLTARDKKNRAGMRNFVLPVGIGDAAVVRDVTEAELLETARAIVAEASSQ